MYKSIYHFEVWPILCFIYDDNQITFKSGLGLYLLTTRILIFGIPLRLILFP